VASTLSWRSGHLAAARRLATAAVFISAAIVGAAASSGAGAATPPLDLKVNFQSAAAPVPAGYVRDFGEGYGPRTGANQGSGLIYGWVVPGTTTARDLSVGGTIPGNGRDRNIESDQRLDTFMHMQADDVPSFNGTPLPGSWAIAVPNGTYSVTVAVGDPQLSSVPESHTINVEGNTAIANYVPSGAAGSSTRHATAARTVFVSDGRLTLDTEGGTNTKIDYVDIAAAPDADTRPSVTGVIPANGATGVSLDTGVATTLNLPNVGQGVDAATLTSSTVKLVRASDGAQVEANLNTSGGGDVIVLQPTALLSPTTTYRFEVTSGVQDLSGSAFLPFTSIFTTGTSSGSGNAGDISFTKVPLPTATGHQFSSVTIGPDGKLYAATLTGEIVRFQLNADGTTGPAEVLDSLKTANGANRMVIGLAFDPSSTAESLVLWVSHSFYAFSDGPDWTGKISRLSGPNLSTVQDYVVGLPRSIRDHLTNSVSFGPDGALYINQGSNTAMGAPDSAWGFRSEHVLNAALLRVDLSQITSPPLDVKTEDGGTYDPFAASAPLTIYASGLRNAYDHVWHSNRKLYVPTNGSAAGGNTPGTPSPLPASCQNRVDKAANGDYTGPSVPALTPVSATQDDFLFRVVQGGYYGHPNPTRCEWVLNGGNPTAGPDTAEVTKYPVGTQPDRNWRGAAFDFLNNKSPDGIIEYKSDAFSGALKGKLIVARYSEGDDLIVLTPNGTNGDIASSITGIPGFTGFTDPLDLTENTANGNLYVTELGADKITLLRPPLPANGAEIDLENLGGEPFPDRLIFNRIGDLAYTSPDYTPRDRVTLRIRNVGTQPLQISALTLAGPWQLGAAIALPATVAAGGKLDVPLTFVAVSGSVQSGTLTISSDDSDESVKVVELSGFWQPAPEGANEPTVQQQVQVFGYKTVITKSGQTLVNTGHVEAVGDEALSPYWVRADASKPVTVRQLAAFHGGGRASIFWFDKGNSTAQTLVMTHNGFYKQAFNPPLAGATVDGRSFAPAGAFGLVVSGEFSDPALNDHSVDLSKGCLEPCGHHVRFFPVKDRAGQLVPDTWLLIMDIDSINYDFNDNVYIIRNMRPEVPPPADTTAPARPAGLTANATGPTTVALDWADNTESDLAGYNVYRAASSIAVYTKLNGSLVTTSQFTDANAPAGTQSFYRVTAVDTTGNASKHASISVTTPAPDPGSNPFGAVAVDQGCAGCSATWQDPELAATIAGGADTIDTAYGIMDFGGAAGVAGRVYVRDVLRFPQGQTIAGNLAVLQVHDVADKLVYEIFVAGADRTVRFYSPAGGLRGTSISASTGIVVPNTGTNSLRVEVSALRNSSVIVRVNGIDKVTLTGLTGATSGGQRYLLAGIQHYDTSSTADPKTTYSGFVGVSQTTWLGAPAGSVDTTPPAAPTGLTATATGPVSVALDWADNTEPDLAGYNVYRAASSGGAYTKLNGSVLTGSQFTDTSAPSNAQSFYRVRAVDTSGNESTPASASAITPAPPPGTSPYDSFVVDQGCGGCTAVWQDPELTATVAGGADTLDSAYGLKDFGGATGAGGRVFARDVLRFPQGQTLGGNLSVFQIRDVSNNLVYEIYVAGSDRTLRFYSPAGGLRATSINLTTGVIVPNNGTDASRIEISALKNGSLVVRIDGVDKIALTTLTGATTGNQRYLRAGIDHYDAATTNDQKKAFHTAVGTSQADWLGAP
jgi:hypothetical protein